MESTELPLDQKEKFPDENLQAENFIETDDLPSAAKILVNIVEQDPKNWRAFNNMGVISWKQKAWEDAYTTFYRACQLKPNYTDAVINLFDSALKLRRVSTAMPMFIRALETDPDNEELQTLVDSIQSQGEDIYTTERALNIGFYNPRIEEANKLLEEGQLNLAMEKYLLINDEEGPNAEVYSGLGIISFYQQRYKDAFSLFYESIKLNPTNTDTFLNFFDAARECGSLNEAKKIFELYCKEFPYLKKIASEIKDEL